MEKPHNTPRVLTLEEFENCTEIKTFNNYHGTELKTWLPILPNDGDWSDNETSYKLYLVWYTKTYSKLGRALA